MTFGLWMTVSLVGYAQEDGPIGHTAQALVGGDPVSVPDQRRLGLVSVNGGCSGTLMNRYWVLTALHCVSVGNVLGGSLAAPATVTVTAAWSPKAAAATRLIGYTNQGLDVALVYLGDGDLGPAPTQLLFVEQVETSLALRKYGKGISIYADAGPPPVPAFNDGLYRTALFTPSAVGVSTYTLPSNGAGQVGDGGDSGGPDVVEYNGISLGIAGVQSTCRPNGSVAGMGPGWAWVTGIDSCDSAPITAIREDILTAIQERPGGQVWVAKSTGSGFGPGSQWLDGFCTGDEVCKMGDVNGDGRDDAIRFVRTDHGPKDSDVWVALSDGKKFGTPMKWHDYFCTLDETCAVADVNGDGRDDLVAFVKTNHGANDSDVYVALSTGSGFTEGKKWADYFCTKDEICETGDVDGDGRADLLSFVRTDHGPGDSDVWVALSTGTGFAAGQKWADYFCTKDETCAVGDVNGDGKVDALSFVRTDHGPGDSDVWVARSIGTGFAAGQKWADYFCTKDETCAVGDVDGDGKADGLSFVKTDHGPGDSDVWVTRSSGAAFGAGQKWADYFCTLDETCAVGDVDGDGKDDVIAFVRGS